MAFVGRWIIRVCGTNRSTGMAIAGQRVVGVYVGGTTLSTVVAVMRRRVAGVCVGSISRLTSVAFLGDGSSWILLAEVDMMCGHGLLVVVVIGTLLSRAIFTVVLGVGIIMYLLVLV